MPSAPSTGVISFLLPCLLCALISVCTWSSILCGVVALGLYLDSKPYRSRLRPSKTASSRDCAPSRPTSRYPRSCPFQHISDLTVLRFQVMDSSFKKMVNSMIHDMQVRALRPWAGVRRTLHTGMTSLRSLHRRLQLHRRQRRRRNETARMPGPPHWRPRRVDREAPLRAERTPRPRRLQQ